MLKFGPVEDKVEEDKSITPEKVLPRNTGRFGPTVNLKGNLSGDEDLIIEGRFQGKIDLKNHSLLVEQSGKIEANIRARNITIKGSIEGNIHASGKVFISKEGRVIGNITTSRISIMDGAEFKGSVKMEEDIEQYSLPEMKTDSLRIEEETEIESSS